jgi:isoleucyl-tRNA synthetase
MEEFRDTVTKSLDAYELDRASRPIMDFVDDLSTWYIRRSRDRFKSENEAEKETVSQTTALILVEMSKIIAPFMPFLAEEVYLRVTEGLQKESVHLENWPEALKDGADIKLLEEMKKAREVVTGALELRQKAGIKVRQPLNKLKVKSGKLSSELLDIIKDEINVKEVVVDEKMSEDIELDTNMTEELKAEGLAREIIRAIQDARKKENLNPNDKVLLKVSTDEYLKKIFDSHFEGGSCLPLQFVNVFVNCKTITKTGELRYEIMAQEVR